MNIEWLTEELDNFNIEIRGNEEAILEKGR